MWKREDAEEVIEKMHGAMVMGRAVNVDDATRDRDGTVGGRRAGGPERRDGGQRGRQSDLNGDRDYRRR